jgi:hypothetical protein
VTQSYMRGYIHTPISDRSRGLPRVRIRTGILVSTLITVAVGGCTVPRMAVPGDANEYYPPASLRLGEAGVVVLHFAVGPAGKVSGPIAHEERDLADPSPPPRLIAGAERYLRHATFDTRGHDTRRFTASFVFELKPCGTLKHGRVHDYAISLCRERVEVPSPPFS